MKGMISMHAAHCEGVVILVSTLACLSAAGSDDASQGMVKGVQQRSSPSWHIGDNAGMACQQQEESCSQAYVCLIPEVEKDWCSRLAAMPVLVTYEVALPEGLDPRLFVVLHGSEVDESSFRQLPAWSCAQTWGKEK